jgi:hypothetical protein
MKSMIIAAWSSRCSPPQKDVDQSIARASSRLEKARESTCPLGLPLRRASCPVLTLRAPGVFKQLAAQEWDDALARVC